MRGGPACHGSVKTVGVPISFEAVSVGSAERSIYLTALRALFDLQSPKSFD